MKLLYLLIISALAADSLIAQLQYSAWTNQRVYHYDESIYVTIKAVNVGSVQETLTWGSACQFDYCVDSIDVVQHNGLIFAQVITSRIIAPYDSTEWGGPAEQLFYFHITASTLDVGKHAVVARNGYWTSDTLWVTLESVLGVRQPGRAPQSYVLAQNHPNPFNPSTSIGYRLAARDFVTLKVYDVLGMEVATLVNEEKPAGEYSVMWNAEDMPSGVYFYRMQARQIDGGQARQIDGGQALQTDGGQAGTFTATKKLLLLK